MNEKIICDYILATERLCGAFYLKYYWSEEDGEYDKSDNWYVLGCVHVSIGDQTWNISDIYTAIKNDIDRDILWKWYDQHKDPVSKQEQFVNLWTFWLKEIGKPMYSKEEIEASEKAVMTAQEIFNEELNKYKK